MAPRSVNTSSQFLILSNRPAASIQSLNFKRWASDEAIKSEEETAAEEQAEAQKSEEYVESSDAQEQNTVSAAISHATETVRDAAASAAASAFGNSEAPRTMTRDGRVLEPNPAIYVGNISFEVTEEDLKREFESFGTIKSVKIATDPKKLSKG